MSEILAALYVLAAIGSSLVIYFRFIDKSLDKMLDRTFASWHKMEEDDF